MTGQNHLAGETSPYLLQHCDNPVHWQPWGQAALDSARHADKPILLSIGYAACHWCHVMAHECFEDNDVAAVMNDLFVNIKVDREERPDIDQIYMAALNATGEQGGWPLTMFLTPDARPFWGGTYFPKLPRYGRPGFMQVMTNVHQAWVERRPDIESGASNLIDHVSKQLSTTEQAADPSNKPVISLGEQIASLIDPVHGGITGAPKFPNAPYMTALWLSGLESGDTSKIDQVIHCLKTMLFGGIYDHIGGGLCRYSTDAEWLVPHFEKMLYDNAQLIDLAVYAHAYSSHDLFRRRIEETINWLEREMRLPSGAYASSLDADSEGEEGKFYLWTESEIEQVLGEQTQQFFKTFELIAPADWQGNPIIRRRAASDGENFEDITNKLLATRQSRIRPTRDDKALTDWNALTAGAIAKAAKYFQNDDWAQTAERLFSAISKTKEPDGRMPHSVNGDAKSFPALSIDYAAAINAAVSLFELTSDENYLNQAQQWAQILDDDHGDGDHGHFLTSVNAKDVPIRPRGDIDEAIPSATAQIVEALVRLASATGDPVFHDRAYRVAASALGRAMAQTHGQAGIFNAVSLASAPAKLVIIEEPGNTALSQIARRYPDPRRVDITLSNNAKLGSGIIAGNVELDTSTPGAWLCEGQTCLPPINQPDKLEQELKRRSSHR